jgi:hypothetical protein
MMKTRVATTEDGDLKIKNLTRGDTFIFTEGSPSGVCIFLGWQKWEKKWENSWMAFSGNDISGASSECKVTKVEPIGVEGGVVIFQKVVNG